MDAKISPIQISELAESRATITIGVIGGMNENILASIPFGSRATIGQDTNGNMKIRVIGIIRLCVSLIVLQTEPAAVMIELIKR